MKTIIDKEYLQNSYVSYSSYKEKHPFEVIVAIEVDEKEVSYTELFSSGIKVVFERDEKGIIISESWFKEGSEQPIYCEKYNYEFYVDGSIKKVYFSKFDGPAVNSNWQLVQEFTIEGKLISTFQDDEGDSIIDYEETFDNKTRIKTKKVFKKNGDIINIQKYHYDENMNLIKSTFDKDGDGTIEYEKNY